VKSLAKISEMVLLEKRYQIKVFARVSEAGTVKKVVLNKRVFARVSESVTTRTVISDKKVIASVSNGGTEKQCHIQTRK
jgi:hypothetical protein